MQTTNPQSPAIPRAAASKEKTAARGISDFWFVTGVTLIVLLLTSLPYLYGFLSAPADKTFMGIMLDVPDHGQYFSWMRELTSAHLISNKLTPEYNQPVFFNLLWWMMGRAGKLLNLNTSAMYQILRFSSAILFFWLAFAVCKWFLREKIQQRAAFLIAVFTSGLGWVLVVLKYTLGGELLFPLDVFIAEANTFLSVLGYPHFIAAALYIYVFYLVWVGQSRGQLRYAVTAGLMALFLGWQHAYDLVSVYGVLFAYAALLLARDRKIPWYMVKSGLIIGLISCSPALYSVWLTTSDPIWKQVLAQFANAGVYTPNLLHLPILLGIPFLLAIYSLVRMNPLRLREKSDKDLFLIGWFCITFLLIYLPVDYQIHLLNGWQLPIAILATRGLFEHIGPFLQARVLPRFARLRALEQAKLERGLVVFFLLLILPTNLYLFFWRFYDLSRHTYPYYLHNEELAAMAWLEQNVQPDDVVLASLDIGQYLPALTGAHTYLGHWAQTLNFFEKSDQVQAFFDPQTAPADREAILQEGRVRYVFFGPAEKAIGAPDFDGISEFEKVFSSNTVNIYKIRD